MDPSTPPPVNPAALHQAGSKWPTTLAIIAIIFGVGGLFQGIVAPFSAMMTKSSVQVYVEQGVPQELVDDYLQKLESTSYYSAAIYGILGAILLAGGIMLLKKMKASGLVLQIWSVLKIVGGGYVAFVGIAIAGEQVDLMFSSENLDFGESGEIVTSVAGIATKVITVLQLIWIAALPVFFLIWFNRATIKEQMKEWQSP